MKYLVILSAIVFSSVALASPTINDNLWNGSYTLVSGDNTCTSSVELKVYSFSAKDFPWAAQHCPDQVYYTMSVTSHGATPAGAGFAAINCDAIEDNHGTLFTNYIEKTTLEGEGDTQTLHQKKGTIGIIPIPNWKSQSTLVNQSGNLDWTTNGHTCRYQKD